MSTPPPDGLATVAALVDLTASVVVAARKALVSASGGAHAEDQVAVFVDAAILVGLAFVGAPANALVGDTLLVEAAEVSQSLARLEQVCPGPGPPKVLITSPVGAVFRWTVLARGSAEHQEERVIRELQNIRRHSTAVLGTCLVLVSALATTGCNCISRVGVESAPGGAEIYVRGDKEVTFGPVAKVVGGASESATATTPHNLAFDWALLDSVPAGGATKRLWVKVIFPGGIETEPVEIKRCENARLTFEGTSGEKEAVNLAVIRDPSRGCL